MNKAQWEILKQELARPEYATLMKAQAYEAVAALLNERPLVDNPEPRQDVPLAFDWNTFITKLALGDRLVLYAQGDLARDLRAALEANNRPLMFSLWADLETVLKPESVTAVKTAFQAKEPDPDWQAQIPGPSRADALGLPAVRPRDVQAVEQGLE